VFLLVRPWLLIDGTAHVRWSRFQPRNLSQMPLPAAQPFSDAPRRSEEPRDVREEFRAMLRGPAGRGKGWRSRLRATSATGRYFQRKDRQSYPLVYTLIHTRLRTGEVIGLRWGVVDLRAGMLDVRYSRTRGEDNPPKTMNSQRTITLQPDVVAVLRDAQPLHVTTDTFVFTTPTGLPLDTDCRGRYSGTRRIPVRASAPSS